MSNFVSKSSHSHVHNTIYVLGFRHQTTPASVREKLAFSPEKILDTLPSLQAQCAGAEILLLSTCNRSEWYFASNTPPRLEEWLYQHTAISSEELKRHLFIYTDREAVQHLYRVACGLDSLILGEPQILGQLKAAYRLAKKAGSIGSWLERLFQHSFALAKHVRHQTDIGKNPVSVAYAGVQLTHQFFDDYSKRTAIIVGAGETAQLVARYLHDLKIKRLIIANRTLNRAQQLAESVGGYALSLPQLADHLHEADMIFGCARADVFLVTQNMAITALQRRQNTLQVYIDLGIPHNFDRNIDNKENAFLYDMDNLAQLIDKNRETRQKAAAEAETFIRLYSNDFLNWTQEKPQQHMIRHIRADAHNIRQKLLITAYRQLAQGADPEKVLAEMSYKLTNKLLHQPCALIHAIPPDHKDWLAVVADTFNAELPK